ncbi:MAG: hypothetical protein QXT86_12390 [Archaeoglobaceae archaeon]
MKKTLTHNQNTRIIKPEITRLKTMTLITLIIGTLFFSLISFPAYTFGFFNWYVKPKKDPKHEQYKAECTEILDKVTKKFLLSPNPSFNPSLLSLEDKKLLYSFFTYFILSDFCFIHLRDYVFTEVKNIDINQLEKEQNILYIITTDHPLLTYYVPKIQNIEEFKSKILKNQYCTSANNLIELSSCLYDNNIFIYDNLHYYHKFLLPLFSSFKNNVKFFNIGLDLDFEKNKNKMYKLIKQIERSNKTYNVCFIYTKQEYSHLGIKMISIIPILTIYCPSFRIEKDFPNKPIPTFHILPHYIITTELNIHPSNRNELIALQKEIFSSYYNKKDRKDIIFTKNEKVIARGTMNLEKLQFYYLADQEELFNFYLDRLIQQFTIIEEVVTWLRKELVPRNILPAISTE